MIFLSPYERPLYFVIFAVAILPLVIALARGRRLQWYQSLVTLFFLYMTFGGANYKQGIAFLAYIAFQTLLCGIYAHYRKEHNANFIFYICVALSILPLIVSKILPSLAITGGNSIIGFLGISYLTFKAAQMIIELRDGLIKEYKPLRFIQFLIFFPTISAGPIDRYRRFEEDLIHPPSKEHYTKLVQKGIHEIFLGFLYNYILGHYLSQFLLPLATDLGGKYGHQFLGSLSYMYVYSLFLFFDFAGYSKFAVGFSYLMGYETPINFNKPFLSKNIKEFWNRWHMSLSFWFRDFVYMRLMMTLLHKKVFKSRVTASNVAYFALFLLMGIWHGGTWYYVAYGFYHALLICLNDAWLRFKKKHKKQIPSNKATKILATICTIHIVCFGFLIFSGYFDRFL
ncbi:MAG: D-alanyl-lipoteichoic acid biosynthesis protein DltB [Clostridiales Family XIII bacterium]|jgi:membrane protein involved in D-alanine export|nr:D-alanyl-lipoteichoic acid biosynthesis protein DltB [Clostridiales Family XIII bacterium]